MRLITDAFRVPPQGELGRLKRAAVFCLTTGILLPVLGGLAIAASGAHQVLPGTVYIGLVLSTTAGSTVLAGMGLHRLLWGHPESFQSIPPVARGLLSFGGVLLLSYVSSLVVRMAGRILAE
jgi:hypothetical protein